MLMRLQEAAGFANADNIHESSSAATTGLWVVRRQLTSSGPADCQCWQFTTELTAARLFLSLLFLLLAKRMQQTVLNHIKSSGVRQLHLYVFNAIQVLIYIFNFWQSGTLALSPEHQNFWMPEIKNVG